MNGRGIFIFWFLSYAENKLNEAPILSYLCTVEAIYVALMGAGIVPDKII